MRTQALFNLSFQKNVDCWRLESFFYYYFQIKANLWRVWHQPNFKLIYYSRF